MCQIELEDETCVIDKSTSRSVARAPASAKCRSLWFIAWSDNRAAKISRDLSPPPGTVWQCKRFHALDPYLTRPLRCSRISHKSSDRTLADWFLLHLLANHATNEGKIQRKRESKHGKSIHSFMKIYSRQDAAFFFIQLTVTYDFAVQNVDWLICDAKITRCNCYHMSVDFGNFNCEAGWDR